MTPAAPGPSHASSSAVSSLPPAFPRRAPWGTAGSLRAWQAAALEQYMAASPKDFLAVATPGAGKTTFALRIAVELMGAGVVEKVTIVCPTEHLKSQWAEAAGRVGIHIDPAFSNSQGMAGSHFDGVAVTYAQVASNPMVHAARTRLHRTLVILDEIHHAGDSLSWGDGVRDAFDEATRRLALTGTPFRSDTSAIPFVRYEEDEEGIKRSKADFTYGYGDALRDFVVRPVLFMSYSGQMSWRTNAGDIYTARLGEPLTKDLMKQAWRTALDPKGEWMSAVLQAADQRLEEVRRQVPDAGGLVIAADQDKARAYARQLRAITGHRPTVVLSDDADASERIDEFRQSTDKWMVAVRMVSEGVDVPRLSVGVYATNASTSLFFAQANKTESASSDLLNQFEALGADAQFDSVLFDGAAWGTEADVGSVEEQEYLGIPGLLEPEQVTTLLRARQEEQLATQRREASARRAREDNANIPAHRVRAAKRKELSRLVSSWSRRSGQAHATIHAELRRRAGGPEVAQATTEQIEARIALLREWFVGRG